ncbi:MAG: TatD family hydrolase [Candidatus Omnitrophica bacterium]|nr:TatD family hydrolase [Candidatus Omnitrophota bacterium]
MLVDTHCHLDFPEFEQDRAEVISRAKNSGISYIINIGSSLKSSVASVKLAKEYDFIYAAVGIHPHEADSFNKNEEEAIRELAGNKKVVAIGEIGLDYFKNFSKPENQPPMFKSMIAIAKESNKPLIIHSREAAEDSIRILKEAMPVRAVLHCFSGNEDFLKACLDLGFYISYTCNITYKKAQNLRDMIKITPLDRLLLETDAPYLSPEGFRGKRNEPMQVRILAEEVARIKAVSVETIAKLTTDNAVNFFGLK